MRVFRSLGSSICRKRGPRMGSGGRRPESPRTSKPSRGWRWSRFAKPSRKTFHGDGAGRCGLRQRPPVPRGSHETGAGICSRGPVHDHDLEAGPAASARPLPEADGPPSACSGGALNISLYRPKTWRWRCRRRRGRRSAGVREVREPCAPALPPRASGWPTAITGKSSHIRNNGCGWSGLREKPSRPSTGFAHYRPIPS